MDCFGYELSPDNPQLRTRCSIPYNMQKNHSENPVVACCHNYLLTYENNLIYQPIRESPHSRAIQTPAAK